MAFDKTPSNWLGAGLTVATNKLQLNTATAGADVAVPELTDAEADPSTGDVRKLFFALCMMMFEAYNAQADADRPGKMQCYRSTNVDETTGVAKKTFTFAFDTVASGVEVADEA